MAGTVPRECEDGPIEIWMPVNDPGSSEAWELLRCQATAPGQADVDEVPVIARGLSVRDRVGYRRESDYWVMDHLIDRGGHRTFRVTFRDSSDLGARDAFRQKVDRDRNRIRVVSDQQFVADVSPSATPPTPSGEESTWAWVDELSGPVSEHDEPDWLTVQAMRTLMGHVADHRPPIWIAQLEVRRAGNDSAVPGDVAGGYTNVIASAVDIASFVREVPEHVRQVLGQDSVVAQLDDAEALEARWARGVALGASARAAAERVVRGEQATISNLNLFERD